MKKCISDYDLYNKKVIIRVDFNVPMKDNKILDDNRILSSLKTINYAREHGAKIILLSHMGRIKEEKDKIKNSLLPVSKRLGELLGEKIKFVSCTKGKELEDVINNMNIGDIVLLENTRFEDLDGKKESNNDSSLGKYWSTLGDLFINDAFATSHRAHASNVGIATHLPSGVGFLIEKELDNFKILEIPKSPYIVILGGAKVSDKIGVIENLVKVCDYILIGGGMAYTFLKAKGYNIGASLLDNNSIDFCKVMLNKYNEKIVLPVDSIVSKEFGKDFKLKMNEEFELDDIGLDIGSKTIEMFKNILKKSNTVVWNGPLGYSELDIYSNGTKEILEELSKDNKIVIIGGGDTASAAINFGYKDKFTHISTGGGASLELLEGKKLPGIEVIDDK